MGYSTFYLFSTALAVGVTASLPLVPIQQIGRRFFILMTMVAVVFYMFAVISRGLDFRYTHAICLGLLVLFNVFVSPRGGIASSMFLLLALAFGVAGLVSDAVAVRTAAQPLAGLSILLVSLSFVASALLLGGTLATMLLGHWYLVAHGLSFGVLGRLVWLVLGALILRIVGVVWAAFAQRDVWGVMWGNAGGLTGFFLGDGMFAGARALFGLVLPLVLVLMVHQCVKIKSNQSATGILYVMVAFVILGEAIAKHMLVSNSLLL